MKLDRVKLPSFSGAIREYPRFKTDFERQVIPTIDEESIPYVLKSCLSGEALEIVKNVDDDVSKMWERLYERYGRPSKVTDAIMFEIKRMRQVNEGNDKRFAELVTLVESSFRDLKLIGMEKEISNTTVVSFIEEKIPKSIKVLWCLEVCEEASEIEDMDKFGNFLKFTLKHKRAIEYGSDQMRSTIQKMGQTHAIEERRSTNNREACWIHEGVPDTYHPIWKCREFMGKSVQERGQLVTENKACRACLRKDCGGFKDARLCIRGFKCYETGCKQPHNHLLHETTGVVGTTCLASSCHANNIENSSSENTMLPLQKI